MPKFISPAQLRGARGMLNWSVLQLSLEADVSISTVKRAEMQAKVRVSEDIYAKIDEAFGRAGVTLLPDDGRGEGVRLRHVECASLDRSMRHGDDARGLPAKLTVGRIRRGRKPHRAA